MSAFEDSQCTAVGTCCDNQWKLRLLVPSTSVTSIAGYPGTGPSRIRLTVLRAASALQELCEEVMVSLHNYIGAIRKLTC